MSAVAAPLPAPPRVDPLLLPDARPGLLTLLLRDAGAVLDQPGSRTRYLPGLIAVTVAGGAALGAAAGSFHGGLQTLYAAIKLPVALLLPALLAAPAASAVAALFGLDLPLARATLAAATVGARTALLAAAAAPLVWIVAASGSYRLTVGAVTATLVLSGTVAITVMGRAALVPPGVRLGLVRRLAVVLGAAATFGILAAQAGWMVRPLVLRRQLPVTFWEAPRSDVFTELGDRFAGPPPRHAPRPRQAVGPGEDPE